MDKSLDGLHHIRNAEDSDQSLEVVGEDMQAHLGLHALQSLGQEMRRAHPGFDGAVWMLNRATANSHGIRRLFETCLHILEHILMFPAGHAPLLSSACTFL